MKIKTRFVILFALVLDVISVVVIGAPVDAKPMSAIFAVNDTTDLIDDNLVDGVCHTTSNTCTLRAAVMQTNALGGTNTINLPAGTFVLTIVGPDPNDDGAALDLNIKSNLTINGAGVDTTIIDGNGTDRVFNIPGALQVSIANVTIRNGVGGFSGGGAIYSFSGNLTVTNSKIISNTASNGGGLYVGGSTNLTDVVLEGNSAANGAGIASIGILTMTNGLIVGNKATTGGGGFYNEGTATFTGVVISRNVVTTNQFPYNGIGGGIFNAGNMVIGNSTVISNTAGEHSGGIMAGNNTTIVNTFIVSNTAGQIGAMYGFGNLVVRESTISGNTAGVSAGISNNGNATLTNVTISGNTAQGIAGIDNGRYITLTNVTLSGNQATNPNGIASSIYNGYHADSFVRIKNTIVATGGSVVNCKTDMGLGILSDGHNLSTDNSCNLIAVGDQSNTNPLLGSLANNGGATQTHALLSGSPAINGGDNTGCPSTDQRGQSRIGVCDIGAYEYQASTAVAVASFTASSAETIWHDANTQVLSVIAIVGLVALGGLWALRRSM